MADIVIVDDYPVVCEGLSELIYQKTEGRLNVVGLADNARKALDVIAEAKPDLVIVDLFLKGSNGINLIKQIKADYPDMKILMLSMYDELIYAQRAIKAGANGYVMKQESCDEIIRAIEKVLDGQSYMSDRLNEILSRGNGRNQSGVLPASLLADRELEVFQMFGMGWTTRRIAEELALSVKTIETYRERIKGKLDLNNSNELIQQAVRWVTGKEWM